MDYVEFTANGGGGGGGGNNAPIVSITSPGNGATFTAGANITINADASDSDGSVTQVEFFAGSNSLGVDTGSPYSVNWNNVPAGSYSLTAIATDNSSATTTSSVVNITVNNGGGGGGTTRVEAEAMTLANYIIEGQGSSWSGNTGIKLLSSSGTAQTNPPAAGAYDVVVVYQDEPDGPATIEIRIDGVLVDSWALNQNTGEFCRVDYVEFTTSGGGGGGGNNAPNVSITSPGNGATFTAGANITINADASDSDGIVTQVEFFADSNSLGVDSSSPYSVNWTNVPAGSYSLTAIATDDSSATTTSSVVNITVNNGGGGGGTTTFYPTDDTRVKSNQATNNYGSSPELRLKKNSPNQYSYLKFQVSGLGGSVQNAILRLYCTDGSNSGGEVYSVSNYYIGTSTPWVEGGMDWNNKPDLSASVLSSVGAVSANNWVEFDVTGALTGNGTFSLGLKNNSSNKVIYSSKEGANPPELVVQTTSPLLSKTSGTVAETNITEIDIVHAQVPGEFYLAPNFPNPFNPETSIRYLLPEETFVRLEIYNLLGQKVRALYQGRQNAGFRQIQWNGKNDFGQPVASGVYIVRLQAGSFVESIKTALMK